MGYFSIASALCWPSPPATQFGPSVLVLLCVQETSQLCLTTDASFILYQKQVVSVRKKCSFSHQWEKKLQLAQCKSFYWCNTGLALGAGGTEKISRNILLSENDLINSDWGVNDCQNLGRGSRKVSGRRGLCSSDFALLCSSGTSPLGPWPVVQVL